MMVLGIVLFAVGIFASIVLHEYGHMSVAQATGMKVRRFFVGFGPTLLSTHRGGIEYGVKAVPLGGFCDIAGMTAYDELDPADEPRAMYRQSAWKRIAVLLAGPAMNLLLGMVIFYAVAVAWGLPNLQAQPVPADRVPAAVAGTQCVVKDCADGGPAHAAGIFPGDRVTAIDGAPVASWQDLVDLVHERPGRTVPVTVDRAGTAHTVQVAIASVPGASGPAGALGVAFDPAAIPQEVRQDPRYARVIRHDALDAVPATFAFTGDVAEQTVHGIASFPSKIPGVAKSIVGGKRAADSPVSVVGASHIGGQTAERHDWAAFLLILGSLNLFIAGFNLVPLTPFDGGHIAVVLYEKIRDAIRRVRGLPPGGPADYEKLAPLTMTVFVALIAVSAIVIVADVVNPIML